MKTLVRAARKLHFSVRIGNCSNTKQLFSVSSGPLSKSKTTPLPSVHTTFCTPEQILHVFLSKKKSRTSGKTLTLSLLKHQHSPFMMVLNCLFKPVGEEEIRKLIVESPTQTCMLDPIPTSLTKECLSSLLPRITRIVKSFLCSGAVPLQFKQAIVTPPLLKKPGLDPNDFKNF